MRSDPTSSPTHDAAHRGAQSAVAARAGAAGGPLPRAAFEGASARITAEVLTWPGVEAGTGSRGEWAFTVGRREIGHLHGDTTAHFGFPKSVWRELHAEGRIDFHPVFPGKEGPAARRIATEDDIHDVIALLRINYDRVIARGTPTAA
jgi:hypothetical protein